MNKLKEQILIRKIRKGDTEAFAEVYNFLINKIHKYVFLECPMMR